MESGQTRFASFPVGVLLAEALGVEPHFLAFGDEEDKGQVLRPVDRLTYLEQRLLALEKKAQPAVKPKPRAKKRANR
jgi:hypothetical protein